MTRVGAAPCVGGVCVDPLRRPARAAPEPPRCHPPSRLASTARYGGWYAQGGKIWVRVGKNTFGHPDFEWRDLPTYMLHEHESRAAEFVLDLRAAEEFLGDKLTAPALALPALATERAVACPRERFSIPRPRPRRNGLGRRPGAFVTTVLPARERGVNSRLSMRATRVRWPGAGRSPLAVSFATTSHLNAW